MHSALAGCEFPVLIFLQGAHTTQKFQLEKGRNTIFKDFDGRLFVKSGASVAPDSQEFSQSAPVELAIIGKFFVLIRSSGTEKGTTSICSLLFTSRDSKFLASAQQNLTRIFEYTILKSYSFIFFVLSNSHEFRTRCCLELRH